jgi:hypothetical protein
MRQYNQRGASSEGPIDSTANLTWLARCDSPYDNEAVVLSYGWDNNILPVRFASHPYLPVTCRRIAVDPLSGSQLHWVIRAEYSSAPLTQPEQEEEENEGNPLNRRAKVEWGTSQTVEAVWEDKDRKGLLNSAGDYFDPPVEVEKSRWVIQVKKNVASVPAWVIDLDNPINSSGVNIRGITFPARTLRIASIAISDELVEGNHRYYELSIQLEYNKRTWKKRLLDQGLRIKESGTLKPALVDGKPATRDVLLNGSGGLLSAPTPASAVYLEFNVAEELDFSTLPLT